MNLLAKYLKKYPPGHPRKQERVRLAKGMGVSEVYVRNIASGIRPLLPWMGLKLEKLTNGAIQYLDIRPLRRPKRDAGGLHN